MRIQFATMVVGIAGILGACGMDPATRVVASVAGKSISESALARWMALLAPQHLVPDPPRYAACVAGERAVSARSSTAILIAACRERYQDLKQRALDFLITSDWLAGEAVEEGVPVTEHEVNRRLSERERAVPNGRRELEEELKAIRYKTPDLKLEIANKLAVSQIRQRLLSALPKITNDDVARYYGAHIQQFEHSETRSFHIVEGIPSKQAAEALIRTFNDDRRHIGASGESLYESLSRPSSLRGERTIVKAIFRARPGVVEGPIKVETIYFLIDVTKVTPAFRRTEAEARATIERRLARLQRRAALAHFVLAWRARWIAKTDCRSGYVVQNCSRYSGPRSQETLGFA